MAVRLRVNNLFRPAASFCLAVVLLASLPAREGLAVETKARTAPAKWETLNGCRLLTQDHRDGDSFHVKYGQQEFVFRLYFVDAPEVDNSFPERNREQCEYFGVNEQENRVAGEAARDLIAELLHKPFAVTTRWQNAMGRGRLPRYYAVVTVGGHDLAEILVGRGLARAKGAVAALPGGERAKDHMENLRKLEAQAKSKRIGIWGFLKKL